MTYDFNKAKENSLTKPRDTCWGDWFKFEKVGDSVQGFIRDVFFRPASGVFGDQRGITLEQPNGTLINVGIKHIDFILKQTDNLRLGDPLTIEFDKEIPNKDKTLNDIKQMAFYGKNLPENAKEKTVAELEAIDRGIAKAKEEAADKEFRGEKSDMQDPLEETPEEKASPGSTENLAKEEVEAEKPATPTEPTEAPKA